MQRIDTKEVWMKKVVMREMSEHEIKRLIERQKENDFIRRLQRKVIMEDLVRWALDDYTFYFGKDSTAEVENDKK
jgi:hypothetical protein